MTSGSKALISANSHFASAIIANHFLPGTGSDSEQSCDMKSDPIDDSTVEQDKDLHMEQVIVPGYRTCVRIMYKEMDMTMMCIADCSDADTHDLVCDCRSSSGLKHRWRWKQV